ncbi:hypothetical protein [Tsukamurella sp. 1534]|uniref:hypothetical protein n=1 Tax=Tsukamurella sp. 1534 TaxID=1151061 RepID=UPI000301364B|nr:hypothetical protein [Tsukamurella sp. 1534]
MPEPRLLPEIRADLAQLDASQATPEEVVRLLRDVGPLCNEVEQLREHKATLLDAIDGKVTTLIDRERDQVRASADRLAATVRHLVRWSGHGIAGLIDEGYLQDGDLG